jgi:hypothetical protein
MIDRSSYRWWISVRPAQSVIQSLQTKGCSEQLTKMKDMRKQTTEQVNSIKAEKKKPEK